MPAISSASETSDGSISELQASRIDLEMGWLEDDSAVAATFTSFSSSPSIEWILEISNLPFVSVPVLSKTTVSMRDRTSMKLAPLMSTPILDAAPIPQK